MPFANVIAVPLPDAVTDEQAITISDIWPTEIGEGDTVAVFGLGPVGQFAVLSAYLQGAGRVFGVDAIPSRLDAARGSAPRSSTTTPRTPWPCCASSPGAAARTG